MWEIRLFICTIVSASVCANEILNPDRGSLIFRKCCAKKQNLIKVIDSDDDSSRRYECVDNDSAEIKYNISVSPLYIGDSVVVVQGLPQVCDDLLMIQMDDAETGLSVSENQCYDRLGAEIVNDTLKQNIPKAVALSCDHNKTDNAPKSKLRIDHIHKCCPKGQSYDLEYHLCRESDHTNDEQWLIDKMNVTERYIYEIEGTFRCKFEEYAVELHENSFKFEIQGSSLVVVHRTTGNERKLSQGSWCIGQEYGGSSLIVQVCTRDCSAFGSYCVRKCCPPGQHFKLKRCGSLASYCVPNSDNDVLFNISTYLDPLRADDIHLTDVMGVRIDLECPDGKFGLNKSLPQDQHRLTKDAFLHSAITKTKEYCLEMFDRRGCPSNDVIVSGVMCFLPAPKTKDFRVSFVMITISSVCLALTLLVYCTLPELRNLHGRTLICHVSMMLLACSCLARVQYSNVEDKRICTMLGYGIYFGFVAAFAWLNVMCLDIWWTFGSVRTVKPLRKSGSERRRFLWYSLYAWSVTIVLTVTMFLMDHYSVSAVLDANIGSDVCWFGSIQNAQTDWPHYIFFVIPMGLVTCTNFVLWMLTARHCAQVKSEVHRLQAGSVGERVKRRFRIDRAKYILTGKLWVVMGAGWVSELLSTLVSEPQWLWNIVDLFNELQGVFIFLILVVKPKVYYLIRKRLGLEKPDTQKNGTTSGRTSSTFLSRTISADERVNLRTSLPNNTKQM